MCGISIRIETAYSHRSGVYEWHPKDLLARGIYPQPDSTDSF